MKNSQLNRAINHHLLLLAAVLALFGGAFAAVTLPDGASQVAYATEPDGQNPPPPDLDRPALLAMS